MPNGYANFERRDNADIIIILILKILLYNKQKENFVKFFREHFYTF